MGKKAAAPSKRAGDVVAVGDADVAKARTRLDKASDKEFRSFQGCYLAWAKKHEVDTSGRGDIRKAEISKYMAYMQQKKGAKYETRTANLQEDKTTKVDQHIPMSREIMDRKIGEQKGQIWRDFKLENGDYACKREACVLTGSMEDPLVTYLVPRHWVEQRRSDGISKVTSASHDSIEEDEKVRVVNGSAACEIPAALVEVKKEPLTDEDIEKAAVDLFAKKDTITANTRRISQYIADAKLLIAQANNNRHAGVYAVDVEKFSKKGTVAVTLLSKLIGSTEPVCIEGVAVLMKKVAALDVEWASLVEWGGRFGMDVPGMPAAKRARRTRNAS